MNDAKRQSDIDTEPSPWNGEDGTAGATRIEAPEFTHLSMTSETPEMASLRIEYVPRETVLVGASVSRYLVGFRNVSMTPEEAIQTITKELSEACMPMTLQITSNYSPREGVAINPQGRFIHPDAAARQQPSSIIGANGPLQ